MYTVEQIRAAGISGEISSIDVEHLINILSRNPQNKVSDVSAEEILEKHWPCDTYTAHSVVKGKEVTESVHEENCRKCANEEYVIAAMEEYASIVNEDVNKEITRLQEKYDENGYDCPPIIKLKRIEDHVDSTIKIYHKMITERKVNVGVWVKASERFPESKIWRKRFDVHGTYSLCPLDFIREEGEYMVLRTESILKTNVEWLDESQPQQKEESEKELEERTDRNMILISAFCEHLESENIVIPESAILSFFNA